VSNRRHRREAIEMDPAVIDRPGFWARLVAKLGMGHDPGPVCVAEVGSSVEADMMAGFLRTNGVNAHVMGDDTGRTNPVYALAFGVRVLVPADQAADARRLLAEAEERGK
jgi:hypothetical protein